MSYTDHADILENDIKRIEYDHEPRIWEFFLSKCPKGLEGGIHTPEDDLIAIEDDLYATKSIIKFLYILESQQHNLYCHGKSQKPKIQSGA